MTKQISLDEIRIDGGTQLRVEIDYVTVDDYAAAYTAGAKMPPLVVFYDGVTYWLADGFHRWHAAKKIALGSVSCDVMTGSQRDAILFAAGANQTNGLRRTNADKRVAVTKLLQDTEWKKMSAGWIADACGVSQPFVSEMKKQVKTVMTCKPSTSSAAFSQFESVTGKDGKTYTRKKTKKNVPVSVPPIDADVEVNRPLNEAAVSAAASRMRAGDFTAPVRSFDDERNLVRALADLVQIVKKTQYKASIDKGRLMHELNEWANDIAEAIEEAEAK